MKIEIEIPSVTIAALFSSAIEGGDPVTTARKGGWCESITLTVAENKPKDVFWYADDAVFSGSFAIAVSEVTDEKTGKLHVHSVTHDDVAKGMSAMARLFPVAFAAVSHGPDNIDGPCADLFLQAVVFGEEKYA